MIREIIVVEGRDDITAVRRAVDAEVVATGGYAYGKRLLKVLRTAEKNRGIIILTDPDFMGERIRRDLAKLFPRAKHAFLPRDLAIRGEDIGVENASPEAIRAALEKAKATEEKREEEFSTKDLLAHNLLMGEEATKRRRIVGRRLGLGEANGKQFLKRLNHFGISREDFERECQRLDEK